MVVNSFQTPSKLAPNLRYPSPHLNILISIGDVEVLGVDSVVVEFLEVVEDVAG